MLGEVPFGHYYGSIDSTPLFVWLASAYFQRTGDMETIRELWPNIEAALAWIDKYGDRDGDGFVEYYRVSENGLTNQGWKDSCDSIMHADGQLAPGSIALCEVQGYVYAARKGAGLLAAALGDKQPRLRAGHRGGKNTGPVRRPASGSRSWAPMPWRWTATSGPARSEAPMPGRCWPPASSRRNGRRPWPPP